MILDVERVVVAIGYVRYQFPNMQLYKLILSGDVTNGESAAFYERLTGRVLLDMIRPSWLIFSSRGRRARLNEISRTVMHRAIALTGGVLFLPVALLAAALIKLGSRGPGLYQQKRGGKKRRTV